MENKHVNHGTGTSFTCPYDENPGFTTIKENVDTLVNENINEIKYIFDRYQNDRLHDINVICHKMNK